MKWSAPRAGLVVSILAGVSAGAHVWLALGRFVPIVREAGVEYLFISATAGALAGLILPAIAGVLLGHLLVRRLTPPQVPQPSPFSLDDVRYLSPLFCFASSALGLLNLVPGLGGVLPVWSYLIVDLRWWWTPLVLVWVLVRADGRLHGRMRARIERVAGSRAFSRPWIPEVALLVIAVTWVVAGTPFLRFYGGLLGDEPKYLRYCETFYQGLGFEISGLRPLSELPDDFSPPIWRNAAWLATTLPGELRGLAADAVAFVGDPERRFNRAKSLDGLFLEGKDGGIYQVHTPGLSFLVFPAYYLDRRFGDPQPSYMDQIPNHLLAVSTFFLALYAVWVVTIFRFLRRLVETSLAAWVATLALVLTLPVAAFPFQFYPEIAAGILVFVVAGHLLFSRGGSLRGSWLVGVLAGYLPWLHVRFLGLVAVLVFGAFAVWRRDWRRALAFLAGVGVPLACFSLYAYRLTGSVLPTAMYNASGAGNMFWWNAVPRTSLAYLLDRDWGVFAHAPVYLLALPGYWWLARRRPDVAWLNATVFIALLVPAAAHALTPAGGTPLRFLVAVLPFAAVPLAELLAQRAGSRVLQAAFGLLFLISLQNALAYNTHHYKEVGTLVDWSFSGWKVNLMFPFDSRSAAQVSAANGLLQGAWAVALAALVAGPWLIHKVRTERRHMAACPERRRRATPRPSRSRPALALVAVAVFGLLGTWVSAATGHWMKREYRIPPDQAALSAARFLDEIGHCAICVSSIHGEMETGALMADLERVAPAVATRLRTRDVTVPYDDWLRMPGLIRAWYVEANGYEPANEDLGHYLYQWREDDVRPEEIRRRIFKAAGKPVPDQPGDAPR